MKGLLSSEMEMVVRAEKFLKEEPERLESALKRCKKLTSTLVTLKRYVTLLHSRRSSSQARSRLSNYLSFRRIWTKRTSSKSRASAKGWKCERSQLDDHEAYCTFEAQNSIGGETGSEKIGAGVR